MNDDAIYPVVARVAEAEWVRLTSAEQSKLRDLRVEWNPPAAGPEVELRFVVGALSPAAAERRGRSLLDGLHLDVLAIRVD